MVETVPLNGERSDCGKIQGYLYKKFDDNIKNGSNNLFLQIISFK